MARTTRKDCEKALELLAQVAGYRIATSWNDVGGLRIDYNPTYGGVNVERITNEGGGITQPFGARRMAPAEFVQACYFAADVVRERRI